MHDKIAQTPPLPTAPPKAPNRPSAPRWAEMLLMLLTAGIISGVAGLLSHAAGDNIPAAILTGGGAFACTVGLLLAIVHYTSVERPADRCGPRQTSDDR